MMQDGSDSVHAFRLRVLTVAAPGVIGLVVMLFLAPIPQDPNYHDFVDQSIRFGIPHFGDVITNLLFIFVGGWGLVSLIRPTTAAAGRAFRSEGERIAYGLFFVGLVLTGLGSAWYHLNPTTERLFWDRLPMTLTFMSLFSAVIAERISRSLGVMLLGPLVVLGAATVFYWQFTERGGSGDLRFYGLVQYYPMVAIPLMLCLFPSRYTHGNCFWGVIAFYGLAKVAEVMDRQVAALAQGITGHNLKHVLAGAGALWVVIMVRRRRSLGEDPAHDRSAAR